MVNLGVLVFVISKTKTPTKTISKISTKSNYDRLKTIIRKTNKNYYHPRADLPSANNLKTRFKKGTKAIDFVRIYCTLKICLTPVGL